MARDRNPDADSARRYRLSESEELSLLKQRAKEAVGKVPTNHKSYIRKICKNQTLSKQEKLDLLTENLNVSRDEVEQWVLAMGLSIIPTQFYNAKNRRIKKSKRYIISSAQTASIVHLGLLRNMEAYARFIGAEIGIIATRYKNPTSIWNKAGDTWDMAVDEYLTAKRQTLHPRLLLVADLKIQATAPNPTNGIELFGGDKTCIVGAPKIEMRSLASLPHQHQKFVYSTGSVTAPSFTDTVAGGKAAEHHSYGFIVVEIEDNDTVHIRNVSAQKDGSFNDLKYRIENETITEEHIDVLVWGDSHFAKKDENVTKAFRDLCYDLGIKKSVLHDIWDSESINVHNVKNPVIKHKLHEEGRDDLQKELDQMYNELQWFEEYMEETVVVASNHDDMLDRAMYQGDWRDNMTNAVLFVEMLGITLRNEASDGLIPYYIHNKFKKIRALNTNDSYVYKGIELGLHGHKGANGSRGSIGQFASLFVKSVKGHSHSPSIKGGCYQVGISCAMDHEYNDGLSSWAYSGCTVNKHGKRQMIVFNQEKLTYTTLY